MKRVRRFGFMEIVIIAVIALILAGMMIPAVLSANEKSRRIDCTRNLREMGKALKQYALEYQDRFPHLSGAEGLELLRKNAYLQDYSMYCCPSTSTTRGQGSVALSQGDASTANTDFAFAGGMVEGNSTLFGNAESAIASDIWNTRVSKTNGTTGDTDRPNHAGYGNMLFHDAHVIGYSGAQWYIKENRGTSYMYPNVDGGL